MAAHPPDEALSQAHPSLGMTAVGPWRLLELRGWSAHGVVYRVEPLDRSGTGPFALKLALRADDARFHREAQLLRRVLHPNVPRLHDAGLWEHPAGPFPYLVMDWVEGVSLYDWGRQEKRSSRQMMRVLAPLARALVATHAADAVHRDMKGDNVLVRTGDSGPVLLDFGAGDFRGAPTLTHEVLPPGTPGYRSPEALRYQWRFFRTPGARYKPGPADDLYAFGVTAWRLVTGTYPPSVLPDELHEPEPCSPIPESPDELVTVCPELAGIIRQLLSEDPTARGSAAQLAEALEHAARTANNKADHLITWRSTSAPDASSHRKGPSRADWAWRPWCSTAVGFAATVGLATLLVIQSEWTARQPQLEPPREDRGHPERDEDREDAGVSLAKELLMVSAEVDQSRQPQAALTAEVPQEPLPAQARPPCKQRGTVRINGGCWGHWSDSTPPCKDGEYEWKGVCYYPVLGLTSPATSDSE